jgi:hypothetical protein
VRPISGATADGTQPPRLAPTRDAISGPAYRFAREYQNSRVVSRATGRCSANFLRWAFSNPIRKVYYNITVTSLSVAVALTIGMIELLQVTAAKFSFEGGFWAFLDNLDFGKIGYGVVALFIATWALALILWKTRRIEARWGTMIEGS